MTISMTLLGPLWPSARRLLQWLAAFHKPRVTATSADALSDHILRDIGLRRIDLDRWSPPALAPHGRHAGWPVR